MKMKKTKFRSYYNLIILLST